MRISDWSSDVCSSDLHPFQNAQVVAEARPQEAAVVALAEPVDVEHLRQLRAGLVERQPVAEVVGEVVAAERLHRHRVAAHHADLAGGRGGGLRAHRSEEHTSELQSLMRISYAVFCLKKKRQQC